LSTKNLSLKAK